MSVQTVRRVGLGEGDAVSAAMGSTLATPDEMASAQALASLLGRAIGSVGRQPFTPAGPSSTDARFEAIFLDGGARPGVITIAVERDRDWVAIDTSGDVDLEMRVWEAGLPGWLPGAVAGWTQHCLPGRALG